ncbi:hypothetical protein ZIOFF_041145 [Zingiber officinale]|uniref:Transmembrane protein n=1 Tax=Zingiber officinale TaxID=94328 RepID=A0A8J5L539_ZINOF|nr:hypothetical protein ZIOFF_041145 [Zingiber officinale]
MAIDLRTNAAIQMLLFFKSLFGDLGLRRKSVTPIDHQPSLPPSATDPESLTPEETASTAEQSQSSSKEPTGGSQKPLDLMVMLAPGGVCLTMLNSVLQVHGHEEPHLLFEPLVSCIVIGFFASFIGFFYALFKNQEGSGRRTPEEVERVKFKWLTAGWLFTVFAFVLWILLPLTAKSLLKVFVGVLVGSVSLVLFFWAS